jgi:hypothetical protein
MASSLVKVMIHQIPDHSDNQGVEDTVALARERLSCPFLRA